jgi:hypothetical protein
MGEPGERVGVDADRSQRLGTRPGENQLGARDLNLGAIGRRLLELADLDIVSEGANAVRSAPAA